MPRRNRTKYNTVWYREDFDGSDAAEKLRDAIECWGTDESGVINILGSHNAEQRLEIAKQYKQSFGEDLCEKMKEELSGDFETVIVAMLQDPSEFEAIMCRDAMAGAGTTEETLIEVIATKDNEEIQELKEKYTALTEGNSLEEDLEGDLDSDFRRLMVALVQGARNAEYDEVDEEQVAQDVEDFYNAGEAKWGTDEAAMNAILCQRSRRHLLKVFEGYEEKAGKTIEESIESECGGNLQKGFLAVVASTRSIPRYFAQQIHSCCEDLGTEDKHLIRLIVSRSEVDMKLIKKEYKKLYGKTLKEELESETGGDFCKMLKALIGVLEEDVEEDDDCED